ncbi:hypothetical protein NQZ68_027655 [Dissostichus eleginoides]|nr:hypothetical protein NQZ68_027655 [Dissostichus eleginoides]
MELHRHFTELTLDPRSPLSAGFIANHVLFHRNYRCECGWESQRAVLWKHKKGEFRKHTAVNPEIKTEFSAAGGQVTVSVVTIASGTHPIQLPSSPSHMTNPQCPTQLQVQLSLGQPGPPGYYYYYYQALSVCGHSSLVF